MIFVAVFWTAANFVLVIKDAYCETTKTTSLDGKVQQKVPKFTPFEFAFQSSDGLGTIQHRQESGDLRGSVKGVYGYVDPFGVYRSVEYVADTNGFRAIVKTNEPGTANQNTADAQWIVQPSPTGVQPRRGIMKLPHNDNLQTRTVNYTLVASSPIPSPLFNTRQIPPVALTLPFPTVTISNGTVTVHLPPSQTSGERAVTLSLKPRREPRNT